MKIKRTDENAGVKLPRHNLSTVREGFAASSGVPAAMHLEERPRRRAHAPSSVENE
jgi:hypothetical protein